MTDGPTRIDELIRRVLPRAALPAHVRPSMLLDDAVTPPARVADKVEALRQLIRSGGRDFDLFDRIASSRDIADHFIPRLGTHPMESLWVVGVNAKNVPRVVHCVARGGVESCNVAVRDIARVPVLNACSGFVLVHNHPSGDPAPSADDVALTERVARAGDLLGIRLLDHVVVAASGYASLLDMGLLTPQSR
ncbi:MAG: JAB domain-containing protein [Sandaracinaceae bacterium]